MGYRLAMGWMLGVACTGSDADKGETDAPATDRTGDPDTDTDTDTDTDADTDADTDTDTTYTPPGGYPPDCQADYLSGTPAPGSGGAACITEEVFCGDVIYATTEGADALYDYEFWEQNFLISTLEPGDLDGPERVYLFRGLDYEQTVTFTVDSCGALWGSTILYGDVSGAFCDYDDPLILGQHMIGGGTGFQYGTRVNGIYAADYDIIVIVDSYQGNVDNFTMTVACGP